jgi:hypothetical protein
MCAPDPADAIPTPTSAPPSHQATVLAVALWDEGALDALSENFAALADPHPEPHAGRVRQHRITPAEINAANAEFWDREAELIEQLADKFPDDHDEALRRADDLRPALDIINEKIAASAFERREDSLTALLHVARLADVHATMVALEPRQEAQRAKYRERANNRRKTAADSKALEHFHAWRARAAGSLVGMTLADQVANYCRSATKMDAWTPDGRKLSGHEKQRIRRLLRAGALSLDKPQQK